MASSDSSATIAALAAAIAAIALGSEEPANTEARPKAKAKGKVAPPRASPAPVVGRKRYYVIWAWKRHPLYVGIFHSTWADFEETVLGTSLPQSGSSIKGFDTLDEAQSFWATKHAREEATVTEV